MNSKRTSIYVRNDFYSPASYYCVIQYVAKIKNFNGRIHSLCPNSLYRLSMKPFFRKGLGNMVRKAILLLVMYIIATASFFYDILFYKPDIVIVCRDMFPKYMPAIYKNFYLWLLKNKKVSWTFDDNIKDVEITKMEWDILCEKSTNIMVTHDYLKNTLPIAFQSKVSYIPQSDGDITREDANRYKVYRQQEYDNTIYLVWVGTGSSIPNLLYVMDSLDIAATLLKNQYGKKLILNVVCNIPLVYSSKDILINNITWTRQIAIEYMAKAHIGIMPLINNDYNRGKGGFKLIQYLTADLPLIASNVGWNGNVVGGDAGVLVDDNEDASKWVDAIEKLATDYEFWQHVSDAAKEQCESKFSFDKNIEIWKRMLDIN